MPLVDTGQKLQPYHLQPHPYHILFITAASHWKPGRVWGLRASFGTAHVRYTQLKTRCERLNEHRHLYRRTEASLAAVERTAALSWCKPTEGMQHVAYLEQTRRVRNTDPEEMIAWECTCSTMSQRHDLCGRERPCSSMRPGRLLSCTKACHLLPEY